MANQVLNMANQDQVTTSQVLSRVPTVPEAKAVHMQAVDHTRAVTTYLMLLEALTGQKMEVRDVYQNVLLKKATG